LAFDNQKESKNNHVPRANIVAQGFGALEGFRGARRRELRAVAASLPDEGERAGASWNAREPGRADGGAGTNFHESIGGFGFLSIVLRLDYRDKNYRFLRRCPGKFLLLTG